ncbi:hypothetical protein [Acidithiobacillus sp.]
MAFCKLSADTAFASPGDAVAAGLTEPDTATADVDAAVLAWLTDVDVADAR